MALLFTQCFVKVCNIFWGGGVVVGVGIAANRSNSAVRDSGKCVGSQQDSREASCVDGKTERAHDQWQAEQVQYFLHHPHTHTCTHIDPLLSITLFWGGGGKEARMYL